MKKKLMLMVSLLAVVSLALFGCTSGSGGGGTAPSSLSVDESQSGQQVEIASGGTLTVTLESNRTTGFQWELKSVGDTSVLQSQGGTYNAPDSEMVGAGGEAIWTFEAIKPGTSSISMEYSKPWEGGTKAEKTFDLTVVVK
ncbi:MAG: protease inhibitor I42 family protein [Dehalococcoidales bacterium]